VTARIAEAGGADPPRSIHRPVQQLDTAHFQVFDYSIHVVDKERELKADTRITLRDRCRRNKPGRFTRVQQIDKRVAELEGGRLLVLEVDRELKDLSVKVLRPGQVLDEERDREDASGPRRPCGVIRRIRSAHVSLFPHSKWQSSSRLATPR
jgi:hypothetical protein